jgi:ribonuclease HI
MAWAKMRFRDQDVWVRVDAAGRPAVDGSGRAEMKYRETDEKSYRPSASNLTPIAGAEGTPRDLAEPARRGTRRASKTLALPDAVPGAFDVWTDGACSGNPGPMGIGVVVLHDGDRKELGEYLGVGTNNIAELTAIERGIELANNAGTKGQRLRVYTDSSYAIGVLDKGWKAKANQELIARLKRRLAPLDVEFVKVAGHAGVPENERCDELARDAITGRAR